MAKMDGRIASSRKLISRRMGDELNKASGGGEVFAAGAEMGEAEVSGARELKAGGDDGGVKIDDGAELDFYAELHRGG
jgi:hypothetical protein